MSSDIYTLFLAEISIIKQYFVSDKTNISRFIREELWGIRVKFSEKKRSSTSAPSYWKQFWRMTWTEATYQYLVALPFLSDMFASFHDQE